MRRASFGSYRWVARIAVALVCLVAVVPTPCNDQVPGAPQKAPVLLQGGDLYTVSDGVLRETDLLFDKGQIRRIGKNIDPPANARVVDVRGQRVYPGLIAPQTMLGLIEIGAVRATNDRAEVGSVTPEAQARIAYNPDSELIPSVRVHGITTAQVAPLGSGIRGRSFLTHLDGWTREDTGVEPVDSLQVSWPSLAFRSGWWVTKKRDEQQKEMDRQVSELYRAFRDARDYATARDAGADVDYDQRWEAMRPVFDGSMPVHVRADDVRQIEGALDLAAEFGLQLVIVGGKEAYRVADRLAEGDVPVVVGATTALPQRQGDAYDLAYRLPALLHEAGVRFCLARITWGAADVRNLPFQAGQAAAHGLPQEVALRALTLSTAEILGVADRLGSLEVGKEATLFVSEGDVMDPLGQQVTTMFIRGAEVDLDNRHRQLYRKYSQKPTSTGP